MPLWMIFSITGLSLLTAFKCPKCQEWNKPNPTPKIINQSATLKLIRETPIKVHLYNGTDTILYVFPLRNIPIEYSIQYRTEVEKCTGITKTDSVFNKIQWFVATTPVFNVNGIPAVASYFQFEKYIVIGLFSTGDAKVIRHELVHFYLDLPPTVYDEDTKQFVPNDLHPDSVFGNFHGKCKGLVYPH